ncbi:MAG: hypothetical protein ACREKK_01435 [Candidatus Methylomirabilales bacterium]
MARYELIIIANIRQVEPYTGGGGLEVRETITVEADGFLGICQVLGQFHELGQRIAAAKEGRTP